MIGLLASNRGSHRSSDLAQSCYQLADAMLTERDRTIAHAARVQDERDEKSRARCEGDTRVWMNEPNQPL